MAVSFMCGVWLRSSRKFTQPIVRTMPHAQVCGFPPTSGEGRLRANFSASFRHSPAYSSFRCSRQNCSISPTIPASDSSLSSLDGGFGAGLAFGAFTRVGVVEIGRDVTIPCRALAVLKSSLRLRRMPGPNETL